MFEQYFGFATCFSRKGREREDHQATSMSLSPIKRTLRNLLSGRRLSGAG